MVIKEEARLLDLDKDGIKLINKKKKCQSQHTSTKLGKETYKKKIMTSVQITVVPNVLVLFRSSVVIYWP